MGETYSLRRLDALEGKILRQKYIDTKFPKLSLQAKLNLFGSSIYAAQMSLVHLPKEQISAAKSKINTVIRQCDIPIRECFHVAGSNKLWFTLARFSFWGTCRIKNLLKKGF